MNFIIVSVSVMPIGFTLQLNVRFVFTRIVFIISTFWKKSSYCHPKRNLFFITFKGGNMIYNILTLIVRVLSMKCNADCSQFAL